MPNDITPLVNRAQAPERTQFAVNTTRDDADLEFARVCRGDGERTEISTGAAARTAPVQKANHSHRGWKTAGAALMLSLAIGGAMSNSAYAATTPDGPQTQMTTLDTSNKATAESTTPSSLDDQTAANYLNQLSGLKKTSGFSWGKYNGQTAIRDLDANKAVNVSPPNGNFQTDVIQNKGQLAELAAMRGLNGNSGIDPALVRAFQTVQNNNGFGYNNHSLDAYQSFDRLAHGQPVSVQVGGHWYQVNNPAQVQELNALEGNGQDNPLAPATSATIKKMAEQTPGEGLYQGGNKLDAFTYLQAASSGASNITYNFNGGPFNEGLSVPVANMGDLTQAAQTAANQHAADALRPSLAVFHKQMTSLNAKLQENASSDIMAAQGRIAQGKQTVQTNTAAAQSEAQAIPQAQQDVNNAQAAYNNTLPAYNAAQQNLSNYQQNSDGYDNQVQAAQVQENAAANQLQSARGQLADAEQRLANAQQTLLDHPAASNSGRPAWQQSAAPSSTPAWQQSAGQSTKPAWQQSQSTTPAWQQGNQGGTAPADDPNAGIRAQALQDEAQASADVSRAHQAIDQATGYYNQAHNNTLQAEDNARSADAQTAQASNDASYATNARNAAAGTLNAANDRLNGHVQAQNQAGANVNAGNAEIQQGQADLQAATQLNGMVSKYLTEVGNVKTMANLDAQRGDLQQTVQQMSKLAKNGDVQSSLQRQSVLLNDMAKPAPPAGYHEATPLVIAEQ